MCCLMMEIRARLNEPAKHSRMPRLSGPIGGVFWFLKPVKGKSSGAGSLPNAAYSGSCARRSVTQPSAARPTSPNCIKTLGANIEILKGERRKVLVSLSNELYVRIQAVIPPRQRSRVVVAGLLGEEVQRRERELYQCVLAVEQDQQL